MAETPKAVQVARKKVADLDRRASELQQQLDKVIQERTEYQAFLKVWYQYEPIATVPKRDPKLIEEIKALTVADAVERILEQAGGQLPMTHIVETLKDADKLGGDPRNAYGSVVKALERAPERFRKVRRGVWGLAKDSLNGATS